MKELAGWIAGVELIGEFDTATSHEINAIAADCLLDAVLLRSPRTAAELAGIAPPIYQELQLGAPLAEQILSATLQGVVVELPANTDTFSMPELRALADSYPVWIGPGLNPERARELATEVLVAGLTFPSGDELKPGLRDFDQLEAVFEALETD